MSQDLQKSLKDLVVISWFVWGALTLSALIYGGLGVFLTLQPGSSEIREPVSDGMLYSLSGIAVVLAILSIKISQMYRQKPHHSGQGGQFTVGRLAQQVMARRLMGGKLMGGKLDVLNEKEKRALDHASMLFSLGVVSWILADAIAVFGFVMCFIARDVSYLYPFVGTALFLLVLSRPNGEHIKGEVQKLLSSQSLA